MKILLLGVGLQGQATLYDLVQSPDVTQVVAVDERGAALHEYVAALQTDKVLPIELNAKNRSEVSDLLDSVQAVICLLPPEIRLEVARLAVGKGVDYIDTAYALPEYVEFGAIAAENGSALLPEFGLDPGIDLVLAGQAVQELDEVHGLQAYGTGIPEPAAADNPLNYKISWTFSGVLGAYQRPARILRNGIVIEVSPTEIFSEENVEIWDIDGLGTVEAYVNGDAVKYLDIFGIAETTQNTGRYSLRWPGHSAFWRKMVALGFLGDEPILVGDVEIPPRQFVHDLLHPQLQYGPDERDIAAIGVEATGLKDGVRKRIGYQMIDYRDLETGFMAMQRTVGFTASIGAQMLLRGDIPDRGLLQPGNDVPFDIFVAELTKRGIQVQRFEKE